MVGDNGQTHASSVKKAFAVSSPHVRRSRIRTFRAGEASAASGWQCEVTQVKAAVTDPGQVGTVMPRDLATPGAVS